MWHVWLVSDEYINISDITVSDLYCSQTTPVYTENARACVLLKNQVAKHQQSSHVPNMFENG